MIVLRMARGVHGHFPERILEWVCLYPLFTMGIALVQQPFMFDLSQSYTSLAAWGDEARWAVFVMLCALLRGVALVVNGTFDAFPYSPHVRALASSCSALFWGLYAVGFADAYFRADGALSPLSAYSSFFFFELINAYRSGQDAGRVRR